MFAFMRTKFLCFGLMSAALSLAAPGLAQAQALTPAPSAQVQTPAPIAQAPAPAPLAQAHTPAPFGHACPPQNGVRFCPTTEGSLGQTIDGVPTFDGVPFDADVTLPPNGTGPFLHLADTRYEARDNQYLLRLLADEASPIRAPSA